MPKKGGKVNIIKQWLLIRENKKVIKKLEKGRIEKLKAAEFLLCQADFLRWFNKGVEG